MIIYRRTSGGLQQGSGEDGTHKLPASQSYDSHSFGLWMENI